MVGHVCMRLLCTVCYNVYVFFFSVRGSVHVAFGAVTKCAHVGVGSVFSECLAFDAFFSF